MRLVIHVGGGSGHLRPVIPIAIAWRERGHQVVVAAEPANRHETEQFGLDFAELSVPPVDGSIMRIIGEASEEDRPRVVLSLFLDRAIACTAQLTQMVEDSKADVILRETTAWAAVFAGEQAGVPVASFDFAPVPAPLFVDLVGDLFARYRQELGLPEDPDLKTLDRWLTLIGAPPQWLWFDALPATAHLIRPPDPAPLSDESNTDLLDAMDDRPLVYATLGTTFNKESGLWPTVLEALAEVDANVVATLGRDLDPSEFGAQPPNIRLASFVSQGLILPHCTAVLAHGGYGSLMAALRHGLPVVSIPLAALDNQLNAVQLESLGAGIAIPEAPRSPEVIAAAVTDVLGEPRYGVAAQAIATSIEALPSTDHAVDLLERLARERRPVLRVE